MGHALMLAARSKPISTPSLLAFSSIRAVDSQIVTSLGLRTFLVEMVVSLSVVSFGIYPPYIKKYGVLMN
jgi:hypothetical protein